MDMNQYRLRFAQRLVAANPDITYLSPAPDPLLAIPVLEIEVNADGSVRHIEVLRTPTQATDTVQLAIAAVRRAAPYGDARACDSAEAPAFNTSAHAVPSGYFSIPC